MKKKMVVIERVKKGETDGEYLGQKIPWTPDLFAAKAMSLAAATELVNYDRGDIYGSFREFWCNDGEYRLYARDLQLTVGNREEL